MIGGRRSVSISGRKSGGMSGGRRGVGGVIGGIGKGNGMGIGIVIEIGSEIMVGIGGGRTAIDRSARETDCIFQ